MNTSNVKHDDLCLLTPRDLINMELGKVDYETMREQLMDELEAQIELTRHDSDYIEELREELTNCGVNPDA